MPFSSTTEGKVGDAAVTVAISTLLPTMGATGECLVRCDGVQIWDKSMVSLSVDIHQSWLEDERSILRICECRSL